LRRFFQLHSPGTTSIKTFGTIFRAISGSAVAVNIVAVHFEALLTSDFVGNIGEAQAGARRI
jgi:hypothetical protein